MKFLALVALLATFSAAERPPPDYDYVCSPVLNGWCPGDDSIKFATQKGGCYQTTRRGCISSQRVLERPNPTGCHTVTRNSGKCPGPADYVWVPVLNGCRWTQRGRCPGGANIVYVT